MSSSNAPKRKSSVELAVTQENHEYTLNIFADVDIKGMVKVWRELPEARVVQWLHPVQCLGVQGLLDIMHSQPKTRSSCWLGPTGQHGNILLHINMMISIYLYTYIFKYGSDK